MLFPLDVKKIIYVDADQVVRGDLRELRDMDLKGAPYGYSKCRWINHELMLCVKIVRCASFVSSWFTCIKQLPFVPHENQPWDTSSGGRAFGSPICKGSRTTFLLFTLWISRRSGEPLLVTNCELLISSYLVRELTVFWADVGGRFLTFNFMSSS